MPAFRFWRKTIPELLDEYALLSAKAETAREFYNNIPINERKNRFQAFRKWLELFVETNLYMIEVVKRFSPQTATILETQIRDYKKRAEELLKEEYWKSTRLVMLSEGQLDDMTKKMLNESMNTFSAIHQKDVQMAFTVVVDTIKRVKGKLPLEPENRIKVALAEHDPRLAKIYEGAYRALESDNPDRFRHCSISMRTLVDDLLGRKKEEIRESIKGHTKSKRESEILEALDRLVRTIDEAWNKGAHEEIQHETAMLATLTTELIMNHIFHVYETHEEKKAH